jgi:hypothetical protein
MGPGVAWWLRHCTTSRMVPGSILGGVTGFFSDTFPSNRTMALGPTQPLVKMSTRNISGGKGSRCLRLMTSPPLHAECHGLWEPKPPEPSGPHRACYRIPLPLPFTLPLIVCQAICGILILFIHIFKLSFNLIPPSHSCSCWTKESSLYWKAVTAAVHFAVQGCLILHSFFLCDFAVTWLENLHHYSNLHDHFWFNAIWLRQTVSALL